MRTVKAACGLFAAVLVLVGVNSYILGSFFKRLGAELDALPRTKEALEGMSGDERERLLGALAHIADEWESMDDYLCISLEHTSVREFSTAFLAGKAYFEAEEYPAFLAQMEATRRITEHFRYDEGFHLGTFL